MMRNRPVVLFLLLAVDFLTDVGYGRPSKGVPLSKVRDGIKNASHFQDMNNTSTLKALDKLVDTVLPNMSTVLNKSNEKQGDDSDGGSGSAMDPKEFSKSKTDPYAAIAAGPDHPKLPPDLKISPGSDGEAPPVVPVGMSDESGKGGGGNAEGHAPPTPEEPNEAPSQEGDKESSEEPDNPMVKQMQEQAMSVIQEQMQNQFKAAMQAAKGMPGMGGMGGMQSMDSMGGMGGMGGMDMGGMGGGMGGMGGMAGFGGMGEIPMEGMYGNSMTEMGAMGNFGNNAFQRDLLRSNDEFFGGSPYYSRGFGEGFREPMRPMYSMVDESPVGRDKVPLGYEGRERMRYVVPFRRRHYFGNGEDFDDDMEGDDDEDVPYFFPTRERAAFEDPYNEGPENEMDDGYGAPYDRKTKIAKIEKSPNKGKEKHNDHKKSKENKKKVAVASKKDVTEKREKTGASTDAVTPEMFYNSAMKQMQQQAMSAIEKQMQNQFNSAWKSANGMGAKPNMGGGGGGMVGMNGMVGMSGMAGMGGMGGMGGMNQMQSMSGKAGGMGGPGRMGPMNDMPVGMGGLGPMNDMPGGSDGFSPMAGGARAPVPMQDISQGPGGMGPMNDMPGGEEGVGPMGMEGGEFGNGMNEMGGMGGGIPEVQDPGMSSMGGMGNGLFRREFKIKTNRKANHKKSKMTKARKGSKKTKQRE